MLAIFRKNAPGYITHYLTFALLGVTSLFNPRPGLLFIMSFFLPVWIASSVIWTEKDESEEFLRTLPLSSRGIVMSKFALVLVSTVIYWLIAFFFGMLNNWHGLMPAGLAILNIGCGVALVVGALFYLGVWNFGFKPMMVIGILYILVGVATGIGMSHAIARAVYRAAPALPRGLPMLSIPLSAGAIALIVGGAAFYGLAEVGVRTRRLGPAPE